MIRSEKGQAIVEFTLVIPILMVMLLGIVDIGRITFAYASLHFSAQETVRVAGLGGTEEEILTRADESFMADDSVAPAVQTTPLSERRAGEYITITLTYSFDPLTPFVSSLFSDQIVLSADSTIRVE